MRQGGLTAAGLSALAATLLLLAGCDDMHQQPSFKPQEAPRLLPAEASVPQRGVELLGWDTALENPVAADESSMRHGAALYRINCALCHGGEEGEPGKVGQNFTPPPPGLDQQRVQQLSDGDIFKRISLGFGRMPAFQKRLAADERWDIVNYVRTLAAE